MLPAQPPPQRAEQAEREQHQQEGERGDLPRGPPDALDRVGLAKRLPQPPRPRDAGGGDDRQPGQVVGGVVAPRRPPDSREAALVVAAQGERERPLGGRREAADAPQARVAAPVRLAAVGSGDHRVDVGRHRDEPVEHDRVADRPGRDDQRPTAAAPSRRQERHSTGSAANGTSSSPSVRVSAARPTSAPATRAARTEPAARVASSASSAAATSARYSGSLMPDPSVTTHAG